MHLNTIALFALVIVSTSCLTLSRPFGHISAKSFPFFKTKEDHNPTSIFSMANTRGGALPTGEGACTNVPKDDKLTTEGKWSMRKNMWRNVLGVWGVVQVVSILANALKRLYPIALQPFIQKDLLPYQWAMYVAWSAYMGYAEGYKAFQLKFSPMVVQRAFSLVDKPSVLNYVLAGPYSMGLFGAPRKRMIVSWCITAGVFSLVKVVKMLPYPYRSIVDAGVVVGLSYGTLSICALTVRALLGGKVVAPDSEEEEGKDGKKGDNTNKAVVSSEKESLANKDIKQE